MEIREIDKNIGTPILVMFRLGSPQPTAIRIIRRQRSTVYAQYNYHGKTDTLAIHRDHMIMVKNDQSTPELRTILDATFPTYVETRPEYMAHAKCADADCGETKHDHYPAWMR